MRPYLLSSFFYIQNEVRSRPTLPLTIWQSPALHCVRYPYSYVSRVELWPLKMFLFLDRELRLKLFSDMFARFFLSLLSIFDVSMVVLVESSVLKFLVFYVSLSVVSVLFICWLYLCFIFSLESWESAYSPNLPGVFGVWSSVSLSPILL